jgi:hypothetical protein
MPARADPQARFPSSMAPDAGYEGAAAPSANVSEIHGV